MCGSGRLRWEKIKRSAGRGGKERLRLVFYRRGAERQG